MVDILTLKKALLYKISSMPTFNELSIKSRIVFMDVGFFINKEPTILAE